jgi:hypothetical protein
MMFSGRISEVHLKNLQSFPWIYFFSLKEAKLEYDFAKTKEEGSFVSYHLTIEEPNQMVDKRCKALEFAVRSLFWKEVGVKISINDEEVFKSE